MIVRYRHPLGMLLITVILAACFTAIKAGLEFAPPLLFAALRALIGGAILLALVIARGGRALPPRLIWPGVLALSVVNTALVYAAMFLSPGRTGAGIASAAGNLQPFLTLVLAVGFLREPLTGAKTIVVLMGLAGVTLISYPAFADSGAFGISGVVLALTVSAGSSIGNIIVKRMQLGPLLLAVTGWQFLIGGLILLVLAAFAEDVGDLEVNLALAAILLFLSLFGTAFITALWFAFVQEGEVGGLATFYYLVPVFGVAIAVAAFGEPVSVLTVAGALVLVLAVALVALKPT